MSDRTKSDVPETWAEATRQDRNAQRPEETAPHEAETWAEAQRQDREARQDGKK